MTKNGFDLMELAFYLIFASPMALEGLTRSAQKARLYRIQQQISNDAPSFTVKPAPILHSLVRSTPGLNKHFPVTCSVLGDELETVTTCVAAIVNERRIKPEGKA